MELNRTEMYIAADAAARAGGRELMIDRDQAAATKRAIEFAGRNEVATAPMLLSSGDIIFGRSVRGPSNGRHVFTPGGSNPNSLQVTVRRTNSSPSGPITLLMPNVLGSTSFETQQTAISTLVDLDIALVLDRSGSMAYAANEKAIFPPLPGSAPLGWTFGDEAPPICRWRDVVASVQVFLNEVTASPADEFVSLSTYSDNAKVDQALTNNLGVILSGMNVYTQNFASGATNIGGGINSGASALSGGRPGAIKVIIVLTDGIYNTGPDPISAAKAAGKKGIQIFTITFSNEADQSRMKSIASQAGGTHFHANSKNDLQIVFKEIARRLPTLLTK